MGAHDTAGTLTLSGGVFGAGVAVPPVSSGVHGDELSQQEISFHAGDMLKVSATGAEDDWEAARAALAHIIDGE